MHYNWMPIIGEFETSEDLIVFKGKSIPKTGVSGQESTSDNNVLPSAGILVSNQRMSSGTVMADVNFAAVSRMSVCELVLGFQADTKRQVCAGLGGDGAMFSIREWAPVSAGSAEFKWIDHSLNGDRVNLRAGREYHLEATLTGSKASLLVDGVHIGSAVLADPSTKGAHQVGVFCLGYDRIEIKNFRVEATRPLVFVVMQFSSPYDEVYSDVIKETCSDFNIDPLRADEIPGPGIIIKDIIDRIARAQVVIADISPPNPNVYFEVGYALALNKPIILLSEKDATARLPFDLSPFRVLFYENSIGGKAKLEEGLARHLREIVGPRSEPSLP